MPFVDVSSSLLRYACGLWLAAAICSSGGCCFWRQQNPVSESLVASRQFSQQGLNAMDRRDLEEAEKLLAQAVRACPDDPASHRHYADVLWEQGRSDESLKQIVEAVANAPDDSSIMLRAGELYLQAGRYNEAQAYVERSIDLDPKSVDAWAVRARLMQRLNNPRQALADAQRALRYDPQRRDMLLLSADVYRSLGDPQRALVNLQTLSDTYGTGTEPQQLCIDLAGAYGALGRHDDAVRALYDAERRGPASADLYTMLCAAETAAGRPAAGLRAAQHALALAPNDPNCRALVEQAAALAPADAPLRR